MSGVSPARGRTSVEMCIVASRIADLKGLAPEIRNLNAGNGVGAFLFCNGGRADGGGAFTIGDRRCLILVLSVVGAAVW